jgi:hypothetical protein
MNEGLKMLPPDIADQPDPAFCCPFCGVHLSIDFATLYERATHHSSYYGGSAERRTDALKYATFRLRCPECGKLHDVALQPEISVKWRAVATAPGVGGVVIDDMVYGARPVTPERIPTLSLLEPK